MEFHLDLNKFSLSFAEIGISHLLVREVSSCCWLLPNKITQAGNVLQRPVNNILSCPEFQSDNIVTTTILMFICKGYLKGVIYI